MNTTETTHTFRSIVAELGEQRREEWDRFLSGDLEADAKNGDTIDSVTIKFGDGVFIDVNLAEADPTPYLNIVLFGPNGDTIDYAEPVEELPFSGVTFDCGPNQYELASLK